MLARLSLQTLRKRNYIPVAIAVSLVLHATAFHLGSLDFLEANGTRSEPIPLVPWVVEQAPQLAKSREALSGSRGLHSANRANKLTMRRLLPEALALSTQEVGRANSVGDGSGFEAAGALAEKEGYPWGPDAPGLEHFFSDMPFYEALLHSIENTIEYPPDFVKQRLSGSVQVVLMLDHRGVLQYFSSRAGADSTLLEAYVLTALGHALREPLRESTWLRAKQIRVSVSVDFELYHDVSFRPTAGGEHVRNSLLIKRYGLVDSKINEVVNEIFTRYVPPIIPLPGGFIIDFVRAYQMVRNIGKSSERDLRKARLEALKLQLDQTVIRSNRSSNNSKLTYSSTIP